MFWLIRDNQIIGSTNVLMSDEELPSGMTCLEYNSDDPNKELTRDDIYYDNGVIKPRPSQTEPFTYWDVFKNEYVKYTANVTNFKSFVPDWEGFIQYVSTTDLWKAFVTAAETTLKANTRFTNLSLALSSKSEDNVNSKLKDMINALETKPSKEVISTFIKGSEDFNIKVNLT